ncbi:hypothetical protein KRP22_005823 [Phytophthora ramorum]|uniref:uncharacterized protein n=1 Tax=Phytophthora ramorum TaxID=164328 RepID=UPI0030A76770|nr:hypothetical protein KRP23_3716 [Phytophthora ramorum]KAH7507951.1 hypothetical protein KRP22_3045 [Phytophthora ramorum]
MVQSLSAVFTNFDSITYENPVSWTCLEFSGCSNWHTTEIVSWRLPSNKYGILYTSDKCVAEGQFHYISNRKAITGRAQLIKPRKFRSMMVAEYVARPSLKYLTKCSANKKERGGIVDETTANATEWSSADGSVKGFN